MKISINSWHFRLCSFFDIDVWDASLCGYFWKVVAAIALSLIVPLASIAVLATAAMPFWWFFVDQKLQVLANIIAFVELFALCFILAVYRSDSANRSRKPPTLLGEWLRAKKRRICPLIELTP